MSFTATIPNVWIGNDLYLFLVDYLGYDLVGTIFNSLGIQPKEIIISMADPGIKIYCDKQLIHESQIDKMDELFKFLVSLGCLSPRCLCREVSIKIKVGEPTVVVSECLLNCSKNSLRKLFDHVFADYRLGYMKESHG